MKTPSLQPALLLAPLLLAPWLGARALSPDTYAGHSVMARGRWVKVSVARSGIHLITRSDLQAWGFPDPAKVKVYGYGGARIPDQLSAANYTDDLPVVQSQLTQRGLVFHATGPQSPTGASSGRLLGNNPYSTLGYYLLSDRDGTGERTVTAEDAPASGVGPCTFTETLWHETDAVSPGQSGHYLVGEDFRFTPSQRFSLTLPGLADGTAATLHYSFMAKSSGPVQLTFAVNGTTLTPRSTDCVQPTSADWGAAVTATRTIDSPTTSMQLSMTASAPGRLELAHLDYFGITYTRSLSLPATGTLSFSHRDSRVRLDGASASTHVWDVTDPLDIKLMQGTLEGTSLMWAKTYGGQRRYEAWNDGASLPSPRLAAVLPCQDLHGLGTPDMVIFSHPSLLPQARRIAALHEAAPDSLRVLVVTPDDVYNEFSSGTPDVMALRRLLKMFHDRGADTDGHRLQYALLMGSLKYDHRRLTRAWKGSTAATVPAWQTDAGLDESNSYSCDDFLGILADNSGLNLASAQLDIAVGRIPARTPGEAKTFVDRLVAYSTSPQPGQWRHRMMLVADNGNDNKHMSQTEEMEALMRATKRGADLTVHKVYVDTYDKVGGVAAISRGKFLNLLKEGVLWWNFVGHSSIDSNTAEGLLERSDLSSLYLSRAPFYYGATCSFVQWDGDEYSGLETLALGEGGGIIGGISASRRVIIDRNGVLTRAMGSELFATGTDCRLRPVGEVLRRAKNRLGSDTNKLRYVLLGDPAMRLALPAQVAVLDSLDGRPVTPDDGSAAPLVIAALQPVMLSGSVRNAAGQVLDTFDGYVDLTLYDAECSYLTKGLENDTADGYVYDEMGTQLYTGRATVSRGRWSLKLALPAEIADNFRNATLSMYAHSDGYGLQAAGVNRDFYVSGYADSVLADDTPPVIEWLYLNHDSFRSGDPVNPTPVLMAHVRDDMGINMSLAGIGHQMSLRIDGNINLNDLGNSYTPDADGSPAGEIVYTLPRLDAGQHTATLKVWDIAGNSASASVDFTVDPLQAPQLFDVYTDTDVASLEANFYIAHNRPEAMLTVKMEIYDLSGRLLWTASSRGRADRYVTSPLSWDLTDRAGHRVPRGIYIYRATVATEGTSDVPSTSATIAKRMAVKPF